MSSLGVWDREISGRVARDWPFATMTSYPPLRWVGRRRGLQQPGSLCIHWQSSASCQCYVAHSYMIPCNLSGLQNSIYIYPSIHCGFT